MHDVRPLARVAVLAAAAMALVPVAGAVPRRATLASNEGQRPEQAIDRIHLLENGMAPAAPTDTPPADASGFDWTLPQYREADAPGYWSDALPAWRYEKWPRAGLPVDEAGEIAADWLWSTDADPSRRATYFIPDTGNGTRFQPRYSESFDPAGSYNHGYLPAMLGSAAHVRRAFCLPANLAVPPAVAAKVYADAQAEVWVNGEWAANTCGHAPQDCMVGPRGYETPLSFSPGFAAGPNSLALRVWSWQIDSALGGVLYQADVIYTPSAADLAVPVLVLDPDGFYAQVTASPGAPVPDGAVLRVVSGPSSGDVAIPALAAGGLARLDLDRALASPGALVTVTADAADCLGRAAGGTVNLLGGAAAGEGVHDAIGTVEETDETNNSATVRAPPSIDSFLDGAATPESHIAVTGASEPGTHIDIVVDGVTEAQAETGPDGRFSADTPLSLGDHSVTAVASGGGYTSAPGSAATVTVDPNVPGAPTIEVPHDGDVLAARTVSVSGRGDLRATVLVAAEDDASCQAPVDGAGAWGCVLVVKSDGAHTASAKQRSRAGLVGPPATVTFRVEPPGTDGGPVADGGPVVDGGSTDAGLPDGGSSDGGPVREYVVGGGGGCGCGAAGPGLLALAALVWLRRGGMSLRATRGTRKAKDIHHGDHGEDGGFGKGNNRNLRVLRGRHGEVLLASILALGGAWLLAPPAGAQTGAMADAPMFAGPTPMVPAASPRSGGRLRPGALLSLDYARDPLSVLDAKTLSPVQSLVSNRLDARLSLSLTLAERVEIAAALPATAFVQSGGALAAPLASFAPASIGPGVGDIALGALVRLAGGQALQLGADVGFAIPTGKEGLLSAGHPTVLARMVAGSSAGPLLAGAALGVRGWTSGWSLDFRAGASAPMREGRVAPFAELAGATPLGGGAGTSLASPVLADLGVRVALGEGFEVSALAGRGLTHAPGSPALRVLLQAGWVPGAPGRPSGVPAPPPEVKTPRTVAPPIVASPSEGDIIPTSTTAVEGFGDPLAEVCVEIDGAEPLVTPAGLDGRFTVNTPELAAGAHELVAWQKTRAGTSERSQPRGFTIEPLTPAAEQEDTRAKTIAEILEAVAKQPLLKGRETPEGVNISTNVLFDFDHADIRTTEESKLKAVAAIVRQFNALKFRVESHTDAIGTPAYNMTLSERRAMSALTWIVSQGDIEQSRGIPQGFGETRPIASNKTPEGRARNRRFADCVLLVP